MAVTLKNQQLILCDNSVTARKNRFSVLLNDPDCPVGHNCVFEDFQKSNVITFESNDLESFCFISKMPGLNICHFDKIIIDINRHTSFEIIEEFLYFVKSCFKIKLIYIHFRTCSNTRQFNEMIDMLNILAGYSNIERIKFQYYKRDFFAFSENLEFEHNLTNMGQMQNISNIFDIMEIDFQPS